jgi:small-conductance mechanosensitive channel
MNKKVEKISEEHLTELQGHVNKINQAQLQLGGLESQKHSLLHAVVNMQTELTEFQNKLEEEYGKVSINIQDGSIAPLPEENVENESNTQD